MAETSNTTVKPTALRRLVHLLHLDRAAIGRIYLFAIFSGLISLSLPLGIQAIIGLIQGAQVSTSLVVLIGFMLLGVFMTGLLQVYQMTLTERIQQRIYVRSSFDISLRIPKIQQQIFNKYFAPDLINRFFDTITIQKSLAKLLIDFSTALLQAFFGLILLALYHPFFIAFGVFLIFAVALILRITAPAGFKSSLKESKYKYEMAHWLEEMGRMASTFRLLGQSRLTTGRTNALAYKYVQARNEHFKVIKIQFWSLIGFKIFITAGLLILGTWLVIDQRITIGQFVASEIIILLVIGAVEKLIMSMESVYDLLTSLEKLGGLSDLPLESEEQTLHFSNDGTQPIELQVTNLGFQFDDGEKPVLENISFTAKPGWKVAICGGVGAGKSSLLQLLAHLYEPTQGSISLDGLPLRRLSKLDFCQSTGFFLQNDHLFQGTLLENIAMGREGVQQADIEWAIEKTGLTEFIRKDPNGLLKEIGPLGLRLSGSVRSRIILARALASKPRLLLLDDRFDLVAKDERGKLLERIALSCPNTTVVAVTNHLEYIQHADLILYLEDGVIRDSGNYDVIKNKPWFNKVVYA